MYTRETTILLFLSFKLKEKDDKRAQNQIPFICGKYMYGGWKWIRNLILPHYGLLNFEIGHLEAEKTKF